MGLMDKVKAQANQFAVHANAGVSKLEPVNRRTDQLLKSLGLALYAERTGRGNPRTAAEIDSLVTQLQQHEAQHRIDVVQQAVQAATQAAAAAAAVAAASQPVPTPPPGTPGYGASPAFPPPGQQPGFPGGPQPGGLQPGGPQASGFPPPAQFGYPGQAEYEGGAQPPAPAPYAEPPASPAPPTVLAADFQAAASDEPEPDIIP